MALHSGSNIVAFGVGDLLEGCDSDASLLRKGFSRGRGSPVFERDLPRGASQTLFGVGLRGEDALHQHSETARRGVCGELGALGEQTLAREQVVDAAGQFSLGSGNHAGGNFFEAKLQQEIRHCVFFPITFHP